MYVYLFIEIFTHMMCDQLNWIIATAKAITKANNSPYKNKQSSQEKQNVPISSCEKQEKYIKVKKNMTWLQYLQRRGGVGVEKET